jgi:hypothetical protein
MYNFMAFRDRLNGLDFQLERVLSVEAFILPHSCNDIVLPDSSRRERSTGLLTVGQIETEGLAISAVRGIDALCPCLDGTRFNRRSNGCKATTICVEPLKMKDTFFTRIVAGHTISAHDAIVGTEPGDLCVVVLYLRAGTAVFLLPAASYVIARMAVPNNPIIFLYSLTQREQVRYSRDAFLTFTVQCTMRGE